LGIKLGGFPINHPRPGQIGGLAAQENFFPALQGKALWAPNWGFPGGKRLIWGRKFLAQRVYLKGPRGNAIFGNPPFLAKFSAGKKFSGRATKKQKNLFCSVVETPNNTR